MSEQKERPILFNGAMVRAILEGRKTVTRRTLRKQPVLNGRFWELGGAGWSDRISKVAPVAGHSLSSMCPFGQPGDRLWVRENYADAGCRLTYQADLDDGAHCMVKRWTPSIHMPRSACRIVLEVTDVRVERLQAITEEQARAEGIADGGCTKCGNHEPCGCDHPSPCAVDSFYHLWNSTGGNWDENPWVWVVEFKRLDQHA